MKEKQLIEAIRDLTPEKLLELYKKAQQTKSAKDQVITDLKTIKPR